MSKVKDSRYNSYTKEDFKNITVMNILAKECVDGNSNSHFSVRIKLHYRDMQEQCLYIPLTYGYDNAYEDAVAMIFGARPWPLRAKYGFVLISNKVQVCTKKEVEAWGHE